MKASRGVKEVLLAKVAQASRGKNQGQLLRESACQDRKSRESELDQACDVLDDSTKRFPVEGRHCVAVLFLQVVVLRSIERVQRLVGRNDTLVDRPAK